MLQQRNGVLKQKYLLEGIVVLEKKLDDRNISDKC